MTSSSFARSSFRLSLGALALAPLLGGCFVNFGTGGVGGTGGAYGTPTACVPDATCTLDKDCLATVSNAGATRLGFRIAQLTVTTPAALSTGLPKALIDDLFMPDLDACLSSASGTTSWLIDIDTQAGTLRTGEAQPGDEPAAGFAFYDETVTVAGAPIHVAPAMFPLLKDSSGVMRTSTPGDLDMQLFWPTSLTDNDPQAAPGMFPFHGFSMRDLVLSSSQSCLGRYTPQGLDPASDCVDGTLFTPGGEIDAYLTLEEVDALPLSVLQESLCVLLTNDASTWGDGQMPARCKRTEGVIDFQGDWCSATNAPADASCHDAVRFHAELAASAVALQP